LRAKARRSRRRGEGRDLRLDRELVRVHAPRLVAHRGGGSPQADPGIVRRALERRERARRQAVGIAEHGVGHGAERARQPEVLRPLVREGEDELRLGRSRVLNVVKRARGHEEHLAGRDGEARAGALVAEDGDQRLAAHAVGELVAVGVPVRLAHAPGREEEPPDREPLEDGKHRRVDVGHAAAGELQARLLAGQRHHVRGRFLHGDTRCGMRRRRAVVGVAG
jgi:hypothetical protein